MVAGFGAHSGARDNCPRDKAVNERGLHTGTWS